MLTGVWSRATRRVPAGSSENVRLAPAGCYQQPGFLSRVPARAPALPNTSDAFVSLSVLERVVAREAAGSEGKSIQFKA
jgi:hypothetical protein